MVRIPVSFGDGLRTKILLIESSICCDGLSPHPSNGIAIETKSLKKLPTIHPTSSVSSEVWQDCLHGDRVRILGETSHTCLGMMGQECLFVPKPRLQNHLSQAHENH